MGEFDQNGTWVNGTLKNGVTVSVSINAVKVLAANSARKSAVIQNVGTVNVRIGVAGVTSTTGIQLLPGASMFLNMPFCDPGDIFAICEGSSSSSVFATEITE